MRAQTIKTESGLVEGMSENGIVAFKGIPYASPPVGDLRWRHPRPVKSWDTVLKADKYAPASIQPSIKALGYLDYGMSEDCLYLNIWKPDTTSEKLPVLVWIHGGGFTMGSTSQSLTSGEQLAKKGIIVVSIAYRLGILGFFSHPELSAETEDHVSGNYGLLDQIFALKWIQRNIESFGGDPDKVTIFGQSAGGQSVNILAASPLAKGLFQRAICMSGGAFLPASTEKDRECMLILKSAEEYGLEYAKSKGANSIAELRKMDPQEFVIDIDKSTVLPPIIDGYVIPDDLYKLYKSGNYNDVSVLLGNTSGEGSMFTLKDKFRKYEKTTHQLYGPYADKLIELYPKGNKKNTRISMANLFRDLFFGWYAYTWATLQTKTGDAPVYVYYFNQMQPKSIITFFLKSRDAYHGSDCAYIFDHLDQNPKIKYSNEDYQLSQNMVDYWINFIKYGDPNGRELPEWPTFSEEEQTVLYMNPSLKIGNYPNIEGIKTIDQYYTWKRSSFNKTNSE